MQTTYTRRTFLGTMAAGLGYAATGARAQGPAKQKALRVALIGCGSRGITLLPEICKEQVVALVDPDKKQIALAFERIRQTSPSFDTTCVKTFDDYRRLFENMGKELDAVVITTPNHHHALPALLAIRHGIHVYVEKPLALTIAEARQVAAEAKRQGVMTQYGQHGHSCEGARRLCEYIWAGAIGQVREVHCWSDRANGLIGVPRPPSSPVPSGLNWENWIGPAPYRDYHVGLHRHSWHRWCDFGNGSIGNMGSHILDPVYWALKLGAPAVVEAEDIYGGSAEYYPVRTRLRWDFPARAGLDSVKVYWYDGLAEGQTYSKETIGAIDCVEPSAQNLPPLVVELQKKYTRDFGTNGSLLVGEKGIMTIGPFGDGCRMVPEEAHRAFPKPTATLPRIKGSHQADFFRACCDGVPACANFAYSEPLAEIVLLGDLAIRAGTRKPIEWDGPGMRCKNQPEVDRYLSVNYRDGWKI